MSGVKMPSHPRSGASFVSSQEQKWETYGEVDRSLEELGVSLPTKPSFDQPILEGTFLTTVSNADLAILGTEFLSWFSYLSELLSRVEAQLLEVENAEETIIASLRYNKRQGETQGAKRMTAEDMKDYILLCPDYQEIALKKQRLAQRKKLLQVRVDVLDKSLKMISRQITLRGIDVEAQRIEHATNRGYGQQDTPSTPWRDR